MRNFQNNKYYQEMFVFCLAFLYRTQQFSTRLTPEQTETNFEVSRDKVNDSFQMTAIVVDLVDTRCSCYFIFCFTARILNKQSD